MKIGNRMFDFEKHTYIMGILNVTPDSFSDGGSYCTKEKALRRVEQMIAEGADIIDVGGESTRPNFVPVSAEEEIDRTASVIEAIKQSFDIPVSLDTYKSEVAHEGILAGAVLINDVWGLKKDAKMAGVIASHQKPCCLMHNRVQSDYGDFMKEVAEDLLACVQTAVNAGINAKQIMLDPGIGFGKTYEMNLEILRNLEQFHALGHPMLLGASRKSVIGLTLNLPAEERVEGTIATTVMAVMKKYAFVRVHDVAANRRAIAMTEAILYG